MTEIAFTIQYLNKKYVFNEKTYHLITKGDISAAIYIFIL